MRISDWSSDVCSSDLHPVGRPGGRGGSCEAEVHRRLVGAARVVRVYVDLGDRAAGIEPDPVDVEIALNVEVYEIGEVDVDRGAVLAPDAELAAVLAGMDLDLAAALAIGLDRDVGSGLPVILVLLPSCGDKQHPGDQATDEHERAGSR